MARRLSVVAGWTGGGLVSFARERSYVDDMTAA